MISTTITDEGEGVDEEASMCFAEYLCGDER